MAENRLACVAVPDFAYQVSSKSAPGLERQPVVVAEREGDASPLVALNYPAREAMLSFEMTVAQARNRCPNLQVLVRDKDREVEASGRLLKLLQTVGPFIEEDQSGVYYLQASGLERLYGDENRLAENVIRRLQPENFRLKTGLAANKLISRIAAGLAEINGYVRVPTGEELSFLTPLSVEHLFLPITGPLKSETVTLLHDLGIHTVGQLAQFPPNEITHRFGNELLTLAEYARGEDRRRLNPERLSSEMSHRLILDYPVRTIPRLMTHLEPLLEELLAMLVVSGRGCSEIVWQFFGDDKTDTTIPVKLESSTASIRLFLRQTERLLDRLDLSAGITEIRVRVPSVTSLVSEQLSLQSGVSTDETTIVPPELKRCRLYQVEAQTQFLPEKGYRLVPFDFSSKPKRQNSESSPESKANLINSPFASRFLGGLRLVRPPEKIRIDREGRKLCWLHYQNRKQQKQQIVNQRGPWKLSGDWQANADSPGRMFNRLYFEIDLTCPGSSELSLLVYFDRLTLSWYLQGIFD